MMNIDQPKYPLQDRDIVELNKRFDYHAPKHSQPERYQALREATKHLAIRIMTHAPDSRERSTALTCLEQAMMWANAAIARNE